MGTGLTSFQRRMAAIPKAVRDGVAPALIKGAEAVADTMRQLTPRKTGKLAESIAVTGPGQMTPPYSQPGGSVAVAWNAAAVTVGNTEVRYAHLVEFGTRKAVAQPYFWPGFRLSRVKGQRAIRRAMTTAVRKGMSK